MDKDTEHRVPSGESDGKTLNTVNYLRDLVVSKLWKLSSCLSILSCNLGMESQNTKPVERNFHHSSSSSSFLVALPSPSSEMLGGREVAPRAFLLSQIGVRVVVIAFLLAAAVTAVTSGQTVNVFGLDMRASYRDSAAMRFKLGADSAVCGLAVVSVILIHALISPPKSYPNAYFFLLLLDLAMTILVISGCAAATAMGYVAQYGQNASGWMPICDHTPKFCHRAVVSTALSYLSFICLLLLTVLDAYKLNLLRID